VDVSDLVVRAGSLDESTKHTYRRADSATLLALLPELRRLGKRTQKEIEQVEVSRTVNEECADIGDGHAAEIGLPDDGEFVGHLFSYAKAVIDRERWVRDELKRRGLIPLWPGEQAYLDRDA
jgi:hypothetical protein